MSARAGRGFLSSRSRFTNSAAMCWASAALPPLPHTSNLQPPANASAKHVHQTRDLLGAPGHGGAQRLLMSTEFVLESHPVLLAAAQSLGSSLGSRSAQKMVASLFHETESEPPRPAIFATSLEQTGALWTGTSGERWFVTGGTGFIGHWMLGSLLAAIDAWDLRISVTVLTRDPAVLRSPELASHPALRLLQGDVADVRLPFGHFDRVLHLAKEPDPPTQTVRAWPRYSSRPRVRRNLRRTQPPVHQFGCGIRTSAPARRAARRGLSPSA